LGRNELTFHSDDSGYRVHRNGKPAKRLSEGERTAIAFIYFIVQLNEQDFNLAEGVVVIDDPVSTPLVCTENLSSGVVVVKSAKDGV
jgi:wobble nucleotide-excising tRNase